MLLRYTVPFLNFILVTALYKSIDGWEANEKPKLGGVYWVAPSTVEEPSMGGHRIPCVVLYEFVDKNTYEVVLMKRSGEDLSANVFSAADFFAKEAKLQAANPEKIHIYNYRIYPHKHHPVPGHPEVMKLYHTREDILIMPPKQLGRLVLTVGMVYGWAPNHPGGLDKLYIYCVYWISTQVLGIIDGEPGYYSDYVPCVVLREIQHENHHLTKKYQVIMMSRYMQHSTRKLPSTNYFGKNTYFGLPVVDELNNLEYYWIYPDLYFEVDGRPDIIQRWGDHLLEMPINGVQALLKDMIAGLVPFTGISHN